MTGSARRRECIFCGGTPLTAEHAWPQWIAKYLPREKVPHLILAQSEGKEDACSFRGQRLPFTTTARCVCTQCNSGWMHELEATAEPLLAPLIQGRTRIWHEWKQSLAAAWAFKTAAILEYAVGIDQAIPPELLPLFRRYLTPRPRTQIWTATDSGTGHHQFGSGAIRALVVSSETVVASEDRAAFGALVFRIRGSLIRNGPLDVPDATMAKRLVQIRPVRSRADWPPSESVDDDGLHLLVSSMADGSTIGSVPPA
jgi:hypothetical protein